MYAHILRQEATGLTLAVDITHYVFLDRLGKLHVSVSSTVK